MDELDILNQNELLGRYISTNDEKYIRAFVQNIKNGDKTTLTTSILNTDFLSWTDETNTSVLEYILIHDIPMSSYFRYIIFEDVEVVKKFIEYGKFDYKYLQENVMFSEIEPGKLVIEQLFESGLIIRDNIEAIYLHNEIVDYIKRFNRLDLLKYLEENMLLLPYDDNKSIIEYLFENNQVDEDIINKFVNRTEIVDILKKYNREDLFMYLPESILNKKDNGKDKTILEELLEQNVKFNRCFFDLESIKTIIKCKKFDLLSNISEYSMLKDIDGKLIIEILIENNAVPERYEFYDEDFCRIFYEAGRYDLLLNCCLDSLLNLADLNDTYLDVLLSEYKKNNKIFNITSKFYYSSDNKNMAKLFMLFDKYDLLDYMRDFASKDLMKVDSNGVLLIDAMIDLNRDVTINKILPRIKIKDLDLALYLRIKDIKVDGLKFDENGKITADEYYEKNNAECDDIEIPLVQEGFLEDFKNLMLSDNKSDPNMINLLVRSYRRLISMNPYQGITELRRLFEIKKNEPEFRITKSSNGGYYSAYSKEICLNDLSMSVLNHEMGHALYELLTNKDVPKEYEELIDKINSDHNTLDKVQEFSKVYHSIAEKISKLIDEEYLKDYEENISPERKQEIMDFLGKTKEEKIKEFEGLGYSSEELEILLSDTLTYEKYIEEDRKIKKGELLYAIMDNEFPGMFEVSDILDAIYCGKLHSERAVDSKGEKIKRIAGHGIYYYTNRGIPIRFNETMANCSAISKMKNSSEIFNRLRNIVGPEFVELITNYYMNNIVNSNKYEKSKVL